MTTVKGTSRAEETRTRLMEAAVTTFAAKGFHGATTRDIARAAGISPTAMYVHMDSKEELLYLISREGHEEALRVVRAAVASSADLVEQLRTVVHDFAIHHARSHETSRIVNYELSALNKDHLAEIQDLRREIVLEFRSLIDRGADAGVFVTSNRRMAANALMSIGVDISRWYRDDGILPDEVADAYAELALRALTPK
jgi:AcrR family transcriptional regulator